MGEYLFIASAIVSIVNGTVLLYVNPRRVVNRVFFAASAWIGIWLICIALAIHEGSQYRGDSSAQVIFWIRGSTATGAFLGWFAWMIRNALTDNRQTIWHVCKDSWFSFLCSAFLAALACSELYIPSTSTPANKQYGVGYGVYVGIAVLGCIWFLIDALSQARALKGVRRLEMQFFVLHLACACLLVISSNLAGVYLHLEWPKRLGPIWFLILHGLTVWAVCYHRVFDAKQVILSVGQRILLFATVALASVLFNAIADGAIEGSWRVAALAAVICMFAITCDEPMRRWMGLDPRQALLAPRRQIIDWARELPDENHLEAKFRLLLQERCQTSSALLHSQDGNSFSKAPLFLPNQWEGFSALRKDGWVTPERLQRSRTSAGTAQCLELMATHHLGALLAVPIGSTPPSLLVGLGHKDGLRPYTFPEIRSLLELAELMDNILTHTRVTNHAAKIERLASVSMISRSLAHDLNNLVTPISTFLDHMDLRVTPETIEHQVLSDAKASITVIQEYIQQSLFFAQRLTPNLTIVDGNSLLTDAIKITSQRAQESNVQVAIRENSNFAFAADLSLLRRLLQNLVFNGIDASLQGGVIEISASVLADDKVCLRVADQGSGISPESRDRIFEPYYTTKSFEGNRRGVGLGLAVCQKIAELHEGRIVVSANTPRGTVFTTEFPLRTTLPATTALSFDNPLTSRAESPREFTPNNSPPRPTSGPNNENQRPRSTPPIDPPAG